MFLWLYNFGYVTLVVKEGGVDAIFDSQTENFPSQKGQSTKSTETEFCWPSTQ